MDPRMAYVFVKAEPKYWDEIRKSLGGLSEIKDICPVNGRYDIVIRVEAQDYDSLGRVVFDKIRKLDGIENTVTCVSPPNF